MVLVEEMKKYLQYCQFQKELDGKTIIAYRTDLEQFIAIMETMDNCMGKKEINEYLRFIHGKYKQKTVKRKIASVKAFFRYLEEEEIIELDPFHKIKTRFKEEMVLPKIIPKTIIVQLLDYLYREWTNSAHTKWQRKMLLRDIAVIELLFATGLRISELCHLQSIFLKQVLEFCVFREKVARNVIYTLKIERY